MYTNGFLRYILAFFNFFYPSVVVCKSDTLQGKTLKKKTLELNFVSTVLTEHNSQLVNCKNCVDRCRTIKKKGMFI